MTTRTVEYIKLYNLKSYNKKNSRIYNFKIYQAMRKYGFDNFEFTTIEECMNEELEDREKYYIKLFNTTIDGYNEALGGAGKPLWTDKQIEACKILYENGWLLQDISDIFNSNPKTVSKKIREKYNINTKENSIHNCSKAIIGTNMSGEMVEFQSLSDAARYILNSNKTKSKKLATVISKIEISLHDVNKSAYGYKWKYKVA